MTSERAVEDVRVGGSRIVLDPHSCFACGSLNAHGLHLVLHAGGGACWTEVTLDERFPRLSAVRVPKTDGGLYLGPLGTTVSIASATLRAAPVEPMSC